MLLAALHARMLTRCCSSTFLCRFLVDLLDSVRLLLLLSIDHSLASFLLLMSAPAPASAGASLSDPAASMSAINASAGHLSSLAPASAASASSSGCALSSVPDPIAEQMQAMMERIRVVEDENQQQHSQSSNAPLPSSASVGLLGVQSAALQSFLGAALPLRKTTLLYRASRDGFAAKDYWRQCAGKSHTLTIVKVKGNGFVCGAYAAFQWPANAAVKNVYILEPSRWTFLFSLVNAQNRPVKLRLKANQKNKAGDLAVSSGPGECPRLNCCAAMRKSLLIY